MKSEQEIRDVMLAFLRAARAGINPELNQPLGALCAWIVGDVPMPAMDQLADFGKRMREEAKRHVHN